MKTFQNKDYPRICCPECRTSVLRIAAVPRYKLKNPVARILLICRSYKRVRSYAERNRDLLFCGPAQNISGSVSFLSKTLLMFKFHAGEMISHEQW
jgi:hypothetical protein